MGPVPIETLASPDAATEYLAKTLAAGRLALLLGAGASKPLGLPDLKGLLETCFTGLGEKWSDWTDLELAGSALVRLCQERGVDVGRAIRDALYPGGPLAAKELVTSARLGALGAMLMGSKRGSVRTVVTFNYDSVLEEYLALHGFAVRVVADLPSLAGDEDVAVYHQHGYIPAPPGLPQGQVILSKESIAQRAGDPSSKWSAFLRELMRSKILLLIGISIDTALGMALSPLIAHEADSLRSRGPTAFWASADDPASPKRDWLMGQNVVPVKLATHEATDDFLLEICRKAARLVRTIG